MPTTLGNRPITPGGAAVLVSAQDVDDVRREAGHCHEHNEAQGYPTDHHQAVIVPGGDYEGDLARQDDPSPTRTSRGITGTSGISSNSGLGQGQPG
jgi:hypothetical protein